MYGYSYNLQSLGISGFLVALIFILSYIAVSFVLRWNMFIKAGEPGWKSLIPIYSDYIEWKIAGFGKEFIQLLLLGIALVIITLLFTLLGAFGVFVNIILWIAYIVLTVIITIRKCICLAHCFGKDDTFGLVGLLIFSSIGTLILSWGKCTYTAPEASIDEDGNPVAKGSMVTGILADIKAGRPIGK